MSAGYAARLKEYPNKGVCGLPEQFDTARQVSLKLDELLQHVQNSQHIVVLTGAGVSTAAGIPDFRGPKGIWTVEQKELRNKKRKREASAATMDFAQAKPTLTHRAISRLVQDGKVQFCLTQNVDGLHQRSGISRNKLAVLHGCAFTERCENPKCQTETFHDHDVGGMSFQKTGNKCPKCSADMRDTLLDWEDPLPKSDWDRAQDECDAADLVICLGTSLRIEPAASLPTRAKTFVIVNLQVTPYDPEASLIVRAKVDTVMTKLMERLEYKDQWDKEPLPLIERQWTPPVLPER